MQLIKGICQKCEKSGNFPIWSNSTCKKCFNKYFEKRTLELIKERGKNGNY